MNRAHMSTFNEANTDRKEISWNSSTDWTNGIFEDRSAFIAVHGHGSAYTNNQSAWNREMNLDSFHEQTAATGYNNWHVPKEVIVGPDDSLLGSIADNPSAMMYDTDLSLMSTGYDFSFRTGDQDRNDMNDQQYPEAWPGSHVETSPRYHASFQHAHGHMSRGIEPTCGGPPSDDDDSDAAIGTVLKNGTFKCSMLQCAVRSFKRPAELKRHYNTTHATEKPEFWCEVLHCNRNAAEEGRPFHRKYRLQDHMRKIHGREVEMHGDDDEADE